MPDDNSRPTHGPSPDQRSTDAPEWWPSLARDDLPRGGASGAGTPDGRSPGEEPDATLTSRRPASQSISGRAWPRLLAAVVRILWRGGR
ncbi:MAG: hypothetical protein ABSA40_04280 [Candidatus Dormibacteria bacterium]